MYEGANYFILGRVLYYIPYLSALHPGRVVTTFIGPDAVVGALTGNGASRIANTSAPLSVQHSGQSLLEAALILQIVCMLPFIGIAARFHFQLPPRWYREFKASRCSHNTILQLRDHHLS